jgi:hypothetical protein
VGDFGSVKLFERARQRNAEVVAHGLMVLPLLGRRLIVGGWVLFECENPGVPVPPLTGGERVEFQRSDGRGHQGFGRADKSKFTGYS